jgi:hypothetical protein
MSRPTWHNATITVKLPRGTPAEDEVIALRAAGIPVDELGVAEAGFLHVRTTQDYRSHVFRWFCQRAARHGMHGVQWADCFRRMNAAVLFATGFY